MNVELPQYHAGQLSIIRKRNRFNVIQCGRRFGKTTMGEVLAAEMALQTFPVGWFAPTYKYLMEVWRDHMRMLGEAVARSDQTEKRIELVNGGVIDYWTMDSQDPARGRKYKRVVLDECGIVRNLTNIWDGAIRPTLTDLRGDAWLLGTPKGRQEFHRFYQRGEQGSPGWAAFRAPTKSNPAINPDEIEEARVHMQPHIFAQEYEGIPADDGGNPFGMKSIADCFGECSGEVVAYGIDLAKSTDWTWVIGLSNAGHVVVSERWQAPWNVTRERIARMIGEVPTAIDSTGVGDPVVEDLQRDKENVEGVKFTSIVKQQMMERIASCLQTGSVRFSDEALRSELESFEYEYKPGGRVIYASPSGMNDDGVCALGLGLRKLESIKHGPEFYMGMLTGTGGVETLDDRMWTDTEGGW